MSAIQTGTPALTGTRHASMMQMRSPFVFFLIAVMLPVTAVAQPAQPTPQAPPATQAPPTTQTPPATPSTGFDLDNLPIPSWGRAIIESFDNPLHPVIGGVASGGGLGFGVGYDSPEGDKVYREGQAMYTVRRYWGLEGEVGRRSETKLSQAGVFAMLRDMTRIDFYGIGPDSLEEDRSNFRLQEWVLGARGFFGLNKALRFGGGASFYEPDIGPGESPSVPSIELVFPVSEVPGGFEEVTYGRFRGIAQLVHPVLPGADLVGEPAKYRGEYQVAGEANLSFDPGNHTFYRWEAGVQQRIPGFIPGLKEGQRLTLNAFISSASTTADIPFYMLYTLGGSGGLKDFRPDLLGSDGTRATLRGFHAYRFRDRNLWLAQAEYRIPLFKYIQSTVFVDSGQVAPVVEDLWDDLRTNYGFSLSLVNKGRTLGRVDVGFGGGEGVEAFWSFGIVR